MIDYFYKFILNILYQIKYRMENTDITKIIDIKKISDKLEQQKPLEQEEQQEPLEQEEQQKPLEQEESEIISCPFYDEPPQEHFYEESTIEKIKKMFPDKNKHMNTLINLYKFIFRKEKKSFINKSEEDVIKEISEASLSLDKLDSESNFLDQYKNNNLFEEKIKRIPVFIDFAYLYYIQHIDPEAPIHKLPVTPLKYKIIMSALKIPANDLYACFEQCICNKFIADVRNETPPFYLRTDMTETEIKEKIKLLIEPLFKDILKYLLDIHKKYYVKQPAEQQREVHPEPQTVQHEETKYEEKQPEQTEPQSDQYEETKHEEKQQEQTEPQTAQQE